MTQGFINRITSSAGEADVTGPGIIRMMCPLNKEQFGTSGCVPHDQGYRSRFPVIRRTKGWYSAGKFSGDIIKQWYAGHGCHPTPLCLPSARIADICLRILINRV